jgi:hypothetical protein
MAVKLVFDSESDGLALEATRLWIVVIEDVETGEVWEYLEGDLGWQERLETATHIIGQNIIEHDLPLFKKLTGWVPPEEALLQDTLIMSRALDYNRFGNFKHSQDEWGKHTGYDKQEHNDWSQFSQEMRTRCLSDVKGNIVMYKMLLDEYKSKSKRAPQLADYLLCEHAASEWVGMAHMGGWPFDVETGSKLAIELEELVEKNRALLEPKLGMKTVALDKVPNTQGKEVEVKSTRWTKEGAYHSHIATYFDVDPWSGYPGEEVMVVGEYCRMKVVPLELGSTDDVKTFLFRNGWIPLEYNSKFDEATKRKVQTSPKITEESLEFLGGDGKLYREFSVASSRLSILKGWIENTDAEGRLHGDCVTIGTPSLRARHSIIVNVPAMESKWGPEMRSLFISEPGWTLVGCDSAGNQGRGLAFYLKSAEYIDVITKGDIHMYNAKALDAVLKEMGVDWGAFLAKSTKAKGALKRFLDRKGISYEQYYTSGRKAAEKVMWKQRRARSKRVYYAFLFGAGGAKVWLYCFGSPDATLGGQLKKGFTKKVPNLVKLEKALNREFAETKKIGFSGSIKKGGYITGIGGVPVYVDSTHKLLVYLLQAFEKATCSAAIMLWMRWMREEGIPFKPHIFMHDEGDCSVPDEHAARAAELGVKAFQEGPKIFGIDFMDGSGKTGKNWREIH